MFKKITKKLLGVAALTAVAATAVIPTSAFAATTLNESGSSLIYPLFTNEWIPAYKHVNSSVQLNAASTGSGTGQSQVIAGTVQIGASDSYMPPALLQQHPTMLHIPVAISAQQVMYNLPGFSTSKHLNLDGNTLAGIYMGQIRMWDDSHIKALNKGVSLPHKAIIPIHRSDSSGDTFLFTQFLSLTNSSWASKVRYGNTVSWPSVPGAVGAKGNAGIVQLMSTTPYSISYVGISYLDQAVQKHLGYAALKDKAGQFVLPTSANIQAAANAMVGKTPKNEILSLVNAAGKNAYPIINYEYLIVNSKQPDSTTATQLKNFLLWAISPTGGNSSKYLNPVHFLPLPKQVEALSKAQINQIH